MRKIVLYSAMSLDGFIARENGDIDWLFTGENTDYGYSQFTQTVDTVVMGGKTFRQVLSFGGDFPYADKRCYVFTRDVNANHDYATFLHHDLIKHVREMKEEKGKDIWLVGGAEINTSLLEAGLIDELQLFVHPVILGKGIPLFYEAKLDHWFKVANVEEFTDSMIHLTYVKTV